MKKFDKNIDDRKVLVARISQLTGVDARYTFVPRCAYEIGAFTVEKDGSLAVMEGADESILQTLREEGLIGECIEETHPVSTVPATQTATASAGITQPDLGTEEWGKTTGRKRKRLHKPQEEQEVWQPETDIFAEMDEQTAEMGTVGRIPRKPIRFRTRNTSRKPKRNRRRAWASGMRKKESTSRWTRRSASRSQSIRWHPSPT